MDDILDWTKYLVNEAPRSAFYIPDFITEHEEIQLTKQVYNAPLPKWTQLSNRRLQNWGGLPHAKGMVAEKIPTWLDMYLLKLSDLKLFEDKKPNHVLVNEYHPGQGIMPHLDGPLFYPTIATISLGSHTVLDFYENIDDSEEDVKVAPLQSRYIGSFLLERRSLVCFKEYMYHSYMHGIEECKEDEISSKTILNKNTFSKTQSCLPRSTRISLTIRYFPKTLNVKLKLGTR